MPCPVGTAAESKGLTACAPCSGEFFQNETDQPRCLACPVNAKSMNNGTDCQCEIGFYAIPLHHEAIFQDVDPKAHDTYLARKDAEGGQLPEDYLAYWCAACPSGANCSRLGTTLANVQPRTGYYVGVDGTNATFLECLNAAACLVDGGCSNGYRGQSCTECEDGLVLSKGFECKVILDSSRREL